MNQWILHHQLTIDLVADSILLAAIVVNIFTVRRNQQVRKLLKESADEIRAFNLQKLPMFVEALQHLAIVACPFCAIASGRAEIVDGDVSAVEEEVDGYHSVSRRGSQQQQNLPCLAAPIRADARRVIDESLKDDGNLLIIR